MTQELSATTAGLVTVSVRSVLGFGSECHSLQTGMSAVASGTGASSKAMSVGVTGLSREVIGY